MEVRGELLFVKKQDKSAGFNLVARGEVAWLEWDLPGEKVNKFSSHVMRELDRKIHQLRESSYKALVFISRKKNIFIAGADIEEITGLKTTEDYKQVIQEGQRIINAIENLPMPVVAAIDGACVGGGCEFALACDYRIVTDHPSTKIGLPEVRLGLIPGWGGCVRLPRVIGLTQSLDIILAGKSVPGKKALRLGLADACVPRELLESKVESLVSEFLSGHTLLRPKKFQPKGLKNVFLESFVGRRLVFRQAKKTVLKQTKGFYPAPLKALEVVKATYGQKDLQSALEVEQEGFCEVAQTDVSTNLIRLFFLMEEGKKKTGVSGRVDLAPVSWVGVLGAGVMGGGIAQLAADKDYKVYMKDIHYQALGAGFRAAMGIWKKRLRRKKITSLELNKKMSLVTGGLDFAGFRRMDVVVEAVVEDMEIKKSVIAEAAACCREDCIMATNTSSLSVTELATAHPHPENFVGMHFFNPVDKMPLVEVIRGAKTSDRAMATIFNLSKKMGKTPVAVKDGPGFLVNRLLLPWMTEGIFLLSEGVCVERLDGYLSRGFGMPMGVYRLFDEIGWDTAVKVLKSFQAAMGGRIQVPPLVEAFVTTKRLGRKNSKGFYLYDEKGKEKGVDTSVYIDLQLPPPRDDFSEKTCIQRCVFQMINEASLALYGDKVVETPQELDLAMIMGVGFPPFRGGLLRYADSFGIPKIVKTLETYRSQWGERFQPTSFLVKMAEQKNGFYSS